jgi:hypothetical protein
MRWGLREEQVIVRVKILVRLAKRQAFEVGHPAGVRKAQKLRAERASQGMIRAEDFERSVGNARMRTPCGGWKNRENAGDEKRRQDAGPLRESTEHGRSVLDSLARGNSPAGAISWIGPVAGRSWNCGIT